MGDEKVIMSTLLGKYPDAISGTPKDAEHVRKVFEERKASRDNTLNERVDIIKLKEENIKLIKELEGWNLFYAKFKDIVDSLLDGSYDANCESDLAVDIPEQAVQEKEVLNDWDGLLDEKLEFVSDGIKEFIGEILSSKVSLVLAENLETIENMANDVKGFYSTKKKTEDEDLEVDRKEKCDGELQA